MDGGSIAQIISTLGFPIAVCLVCFWFINKLTEQHKEEMEKITTTHKEEMDKLTVSINNNTLVMQKLVDKLGVTDYEIKS